MASISRWQRYSTVCAYCLIISSAVTAFGFDSGITSGFLAMNVWLQDFGTCDSSTGTCTMSASHTSLFQGINLAAACLAASVAGTISAKWGRKVGLALCAITNLLGSGVMMIPHYSALVVGKGLTGMSIGFAGAFAIVFWSEIAPVELRGIIVILYQLFINIPIFVASCVDQGTHNWNNRLSYQVPLVVTLIFPTIALATIWFVPESPRWFITHDRIDEAKAAIRKLRGKHVPQEELDSEIEESIKFTEIEKEASATSTYLDCFKGIDRRRTLIAMFMMGGQQMMGISLTTLYVTYFFNLTGFKNAFVVTLIVDACQMIGPILTFFAIPFVGRRRILIFGAAVNCICMFAFSIISTASPNSSASGASVVAFICIFVCCYAGTWGSCGPIVMGEIPSNRLRSKSAAIALSFSWVLCELVTCSLPYLLDSDYANLGTKVGFLFGACCLIILILTILFVPETKGRTLEEIDEMFLYRLPTRGFKSYVCTRDALGGHSVKKEIDIEHIEDSESI